MFMKRRTEDCEIEKQHDGRQLDKQIASSSLRNSIDIAKLEKLLSWEI